MKINIQFFISSYLMIAVIGYVFFTIFFKEKKYALKFSFFVYCFYLVLLLFFLEDITVRNYLIFNFDFQSFSSKYILNSSVNLKPFFILDYLDHKATLLGFIFNIICFIPLGIFLAYIYKYFKCKTITVVINVLLISIAIELLQFVLPIDRVSDIDDVISNSFGGLLGATLYNVYIYRYKKIN